MTIGTKIGLGYGLALTTLAAIGALSYWGTHKLIETSHAVAHSHRVLEGVEALQSSLKDAETGQRGFVLTGKPQYLEPYNTARGEVDRTMDTLLTLTADNAAQRQRLEALNAPIDAKFVELAQTIRLRGQGDHDQGFRAALDIIMTDSGKESMDAARKIMGAIKSTEVGTLAMREREAEATARLTYSVIGSGTLLAVLIVTVGGYLITRSITRPIHQAVNHLAATAAEILASTTQQAAGAQEQAAATAETVATIDEVTQTASQAAQRARDVGDGARRNLEVGQAGRQAADDSIAATTRVKEQVESTAGSILMLAEQAQAIGEIIATVNDIAEQTNMLALNAAIEASRAGEQGRGFAVVATEVKALADQSKKATTQVRQILGEIQKATNGAVLSTEDVTKGVAAAIRVSDQSGRTIQTLADALADAAQAAVQIVASAGQQAAGMVQINQAMRNIDQVARQNLSAMQQAEEAARNLNDLGLQLSRLIGT